MSTTYGTWTERDVLLEHGERLAEVTHGYALTGRPAADGRNVVVVLHSLTGNADVHEWWRPLVGPGAALDTERVAILAPDLLGGCGRTRASPAPTTLTPRDLARRVWALCDGLGVAAPLAVIGGSLGGMVALELAALAPTRAARTLVFAAPARQTALGAGWGAAMREALAVGGNERGLALARMIAMLSYRSPAGLERRFGGDDPAAAIGDWLAHHGRALVARFDAGAYRTLLDAMDRHDVGRGRASIAAALAPAGDRLVGVGVPGDLLYPHDTVAQWCAAAGARYRELVSDHGHDAFLLEDNQVGALIRAVLAEADAVQDAGPRPTRPRRVALAGAGTVGDALAGRIAAAAQARRAADAPDLVLARALVRDPARPRPGVEACRAAGAASDGSLAVHADGAGAQAADADAAASDPLLVTDPDALVAGDVDVLIEALGGIDPAYALVRGALARGLPVVTANKALVAARGPELLAIALRTGASFDFEAAVAAAVPVVRTLRSRGPEAPAITAIEGILNGTTNAVLDALHRGTSFAEAVAAAQAAGFAEADPSRDLDGRDAEDKLRILAWLAFGIAPAALKVTRTPLNARAEELVQRAAADGAVVRVIARASADGTATIAPIAAPADGPWGTVRCAGNRVVLHEAGGGHVALAGPGAGGGPTAAALWRDLHHPLPVSGGGGVAAASRAGPPPALSPGRSFAAPESPLLRRGARLSL
jgi:homoserine O-acetyltransferase